jgi:hypothetical protein
MKTIFFTILTLVFLSPTLFGQKKEEPVNTKPGEQITVNKEYDDAGNLIRFDSTYTFEWFGDTMMAFPNGNNSFFHNGEFPDMESLFNGVYSDSLHNFSPFDNEWGKNFFEGHEDFMKDFHQRFFNDYSLQSDSLNHFFGNDSTFEFPFRFGEFDFPDMSEFFKNFDEFNNQGQPFFKDDEQQKEWEEMMNQHQKEMEEFQKKWDSKNKSKPKADIKLQKI